MLNLLEVTAEKIIHAGRLLRQRPENPKDLHPRTLQAQRPYTYARRYQRQKNPWDPRAGPIINQRPENPKDLHPGTVSAQRPIETLGHLCWKLSEAKKPLGSPCWTTIKSEAREPE
jgi:hypothetical protein